MKRCVLLHGFLHCIIDDNSLSHTLLELIFVLHPKIKLFFYIIKDPAIIM